MSAPATILYVEDDPGLRQLLVDHFESLTPDLAVEVAKNGQEGIRVQKRTEVDCIVSDYDMPRVDGKEMVEKLREDGVSTPVIFYTASGTLQAEIEGQFDDPPEAIIKKESNNLNGVFDAVVDCIETSSETNLSISPST